jgi:hypothetical protein
MDNMAEAIAQMITEHIGRLDGPGLLMMGDHVFALLNCPDRVDGVRAINRPDLGDANVKAVWFEQSGAGIRPARWKLIEFDADLVARAFLEWC